MLSIWLINQKLDLLLSKILSWHGNITSNFPLIHKLLIKCLDKLMCQILVQLNLVSSFLQLLIKNNFYLKRICHIYSVSLTLTKTMEFRELRLRDSLMIKVEKFRKSRLLLWWMILAKRLINLLIFRNFMIWWINYIEIWIFDVKN